MMLGICAYCGETRELTKDHIPPRNIFPKPRPNNLITVACCESCRVGWSDDDEYFRLAVTANNSVTHHSDAQRAFKILLRSFRKPAKWKFAKFINESLGNVDVVTKGGIYLGSADVIRLDAKRIERVVIRIIRGLFYNEKGYIVPLNYKISGRLMQQGYKEVLDSIPKGSFKPWKVVGQNHFRYTYAETVEDKNCMIWVCLFFGGLFMFGFITRENGD